jgi:hypothetical protein
MRTGTTRIVTNLGCVESFSSPLFGQPTGPTARKSQEY